MRVQARELRGPLQVEFPAVAIYLAGITHHFTADDIQAIFRKWYVNGIEAARLNVMNVCERSAWQQTFI